MADKGKRDKGKKELIVIGVKSALDSPLYSNNDILQDSRPHIFSVDEIGVKSALDSPLYSDNDILQDSRPHIFSVDETSKVFLDEISGMAEAFGNNYMLSSATEHEGFPPESGTIHFQLRRNRHG